MTARPLGSVKTKRPEKVRLGDWLIVPEFGEGKVTFIWSREGRWLFQVESPEAPTGYATWTFPEDQRISTINGGRK